MDKLRSILGPAGLILILAGSVIYGVMYTSGWVAFLPLLAGLACSLAALVTGYRSSPNEGQRRSARQGLNAGISILVVAGIFIFVQTLSTRHNLRIDTTTNKRFSLSPQTMKVLRSLETDVMFVCFYKDTAPEKTEVYDILSEYNTVTPRVDFKFIDPDKDPVTARRYDLKNYGSTFIEVSGKKELVDGISEEKMTNAINRILATETKTVYFTTGHGEKSITNTDPSGYNTLSSSLKLENFAVKEFLPLGSEKVPEDCTLLVVAGPSEDILKIEQNIILDYLTSGGNALLLLDPAVDLPLLSGIARAYGILVGEDIIIDRYGKLLAGNYLTPVINQYGTHPITEGFKLFSFFPQARSVFVKSSLPDAVTVTVLGKTDADAYAESDVDTLILIGKTQFEGEKDIAGPINIAVAGEMELVLAKADSTADRARRFSRIVVFGDSDFAGNANLKLSGNRDLILNTVNWLAEEEDLISIRPVDNLNQPVLLSTKQGRIVFWLPVIGLPAIFAVIGVLVNLRRRRWE